MLSKAYKWNHQSFNKYFNMVGVDIFIPDGGLKNMDD